MLQDDVPDVAGSNANVFPILGRPPPTDANYKIRSKMPTSSFASLKLMRQLTQARFSPLPEIMDEAVRSQGFPAALFSQLG